MTSGRIPFDAQDTYRILEAQIVPQEEPNWLRHSKGSAAIDRSLIVGATIKEMIKSSGRTTGGVRDHLRHLEGEHGIRIIKEDNIYRFMHKQEAVNGVYPDSVEPPPYEPAPDREPDLEGPDDDEQQPDPRGEGGVAEVTPSGENTASGCDIEVIIRDAKTVLDAVSGRTGRCGVAFLDTDFQPQTHTRGCIDFHGPGIYALLFTPANGGAERVVYIGSYCSAFRGHIIHERWRKHLGTCTARGQTVSVRPGVQQWLAATLPPLGHPLAALTGNVRLEADAGCQAARNRLRFALENWSMFCPANAPDLLAPFRWVYVRLRRQPPGLNLRALRASIKEAEADLVDLLLPQCNDYRVVPWEMARRDVSANEFIHEAMQRLCKLWPPDRAATSD